MTNNYALGFLTASRGITKQSVVGFTANTMRRVAQSRIVAAKSYQTNNNGVVFMNKMRL